MCLPISNRWPNIHLIVPRDLFWFQMGRNLSMMDFAISVVGACRCAMSIKGFEHLWFGLYVWTLSCTWSWFDDISVNTPRTILMFATCRHFGRVGLQVFKRKIAMNCKLSQSLSECLMIRKFTPYSHFPCWVDTNIRVHVLKYRVVLEINNWSLIWTILQY